MDLTCGKDMSFPGKAASSSVKLGPHKPPFMWSAPPQRKRYVDTKADINCKALTLFLIVMGRVPSLDTELLGTDIGSSWAWPSVSGSLLPLGDSRVQRDQQCHRRTEQGKKKVTQKTPARRFNVHSSVLERSPSTAPALGYTALLQTPQHCLTGTQGNGTKDIGLKVI